MRCEDCDTAAKEPHHGFRANCKGCAARAVSRGPNWRRVRDAGMQDRRYRAELELLGVTHEAVREAAAADRLNQPERTT